MKFLVVDTETTGIEWHRSGVIELAFVLGQDSDIISTFQATWKPLPWMTVDPWVAENGKAYREAIQNDSDAEMLFSESMLRLSTWLESVKEHEPIWAAYNAPFDIAMLKALELKESVRFSKYTDYNWIDVLVWQRHLNLQGNQLEKACSRYGIEIGTAHRALDDAKATFLLLDKLRGETFPNDPVSFPASDLLKQQQLLAAKFEFERLVKHY